MIRLDSVSKRFPGQHHRGHRPDPRGAGGEILRAGRSVRLREDHSRMVNRLIEPSSGRIYLDDEDVTGVDPVGLRRRIGYVIQQVGLFPHQTIAANVGTVPRLGWNRDRVKDPRERAPRARGPRPDDVPGAVPDPAVRRPAPAVGVARAWLPIRPCCSWTSRSAPSTPSPGCGCRTSSCASRRRSARPSCSSPTTSRKR